MSAKKSMIEPRTLIYILIIVLIIAGVAYFVLTYEPSDTLNVSQVISPNNEHIGKTVEVQGVYHSEEEDYLKSKYSTNANPNPTEMLPLNLSQMGNQTLTEGQQ